MGLKYTSSTEYATNKIVEFNISAINDPDNENIKRIKESFMFFEERTFGTIYRRRDSNDYWYLDTKKTIARLITSDQLDLFTKMGIRKFITIG